MPRRIRVVVPRVRTAVGDASVSSSDDMLVCYVGLLLNLSFMGLVLLLLLLCVVQLWFLVGWFVGFVAWL